LNLATLRVVPLAGENFLNTCFMFHVSCFIKLSLPLFMFWIFTNYINPAFSPDYLAFIANFFHRCPYFHKLHVIYNIKHATKLLRVMRYMIIIFLLSFRAFRHTESFQPSPYHLPKHGFYASVNDPINGPRLRYRCPAQS